MKRQGSLIVSVLLAGLLTVGCVSKGTYGQVVQERDGLNQQLLTRTTERDSTQQSLNTSLAELTTTKTERDNTQRDLAAARTEATSVKGERDTAQTNLNTANQRAATLQADLTRAQSDLAAAKQTYDTLKARSDKVQKYANVIEPYLRLNVAYQRDNSLESVRAFGQTSGAVEATLDQPLKDSWEKVLAAATSDKPEEEIDELELEFRALLAQRFAETR